MLLSFDLTLSIPFIFFKLLTHTGMLVGVVTMSTYKTRALKEVRAQKNSTNKR